MLITNWGPVESKTGEGRRFWLCPECGCHLPYDPFDPARKSLNLRPVNWRRSFGSPGKDLSETTWHLACPSWSFCILFLLRQYHRNHEDPLQKSPYGQPFEQPS